MKKTEALKLESEGYGRAVKLIGLEWMIDVTISFKEWCKKEKLPQDRIARLVFNSWKESVQFPNPTMRFK